MTWESAILVTLIALSAAFAWRKACHVIGDWLNPPPSEEEPHGDSSKDRTAQTYVRRSV